MARKPKTETTTQTETADPVPQAAPNVDRMRIALERIRDFQFGTDERPSPATRAIAELQKIATDGLA